MPVLIAEHLTKYYGAELVLDDVSLTIHEGDRIGLIGANGTGKTTLCRLLLSETEPDDGTLSVTRGVTLGYLPQDCAFPPGQTLWQAALGVFPDILALEDRLADLAAHMAHATGPDLEALIAQHERTREELERAGGYGYETRAATVLTGLGFREADFRRELMTFSGGERNRAALAVLLLRDPDVLLLDEPTNHLDIQGTEWLEEYLATYHGAAVVISHDRRFLNAVVRRVLDLADHRLTEYAGDYDDYVRQKEDALLHYERTYEKQQRERQRQLAFIRWALGTCQEKRVRAAKSRMKLLDKVEWLDPPAGERRKANLRFTPRVRGGNEILELQEVTVGYDRPLLREVDLFLRRGDRVGLVGPNGSGKTTLLKVAIGELRPLAGLARLGRSVEVGYFAQQRLEINPANTVLDDFAEVVADATRGELRHLLARFLFVEEDVFKLVGQLSGGEQSRLALAKLIMSRPTFLVLDEPTNHLDIDSRGALEGALREYSGTILVVSHDRYFLDAVVQRVLVIEGNGAHLHDGNYSAYRETVRAREEARRLAEAEARETDKQARLRDERSARRERQRLAAAGKLGPTPAQLRRRAAELEDRVSDLEARQTKVESLLADPTTYAEPARVTALSVEHQRLQQELATTLAEWEQVSGSL
jgi:ATP-binding cassette subfamily F protein 3